MSDATVNKHGVLVSTGHISWRCFQIEDKQAIMLQQWDKITGIKSEQETEWEKWTTVQYILCF